MGNADVGEAGEDAALGAYRALGFRLVARNWRCPLGEVDLILVRRRLLVFCEVKTRRGLVHGGPHEAVTWRKQRKLRALAETFLAASKPAAWDIRFDVASVTMDGRGGRRVHLFEDAF